MLKLVPKKQLQFAARIGSVCIAPFGNAQIFRWFHSEMSSLPGRFHRKKQEDIFFPLRENIIIIRKIFFPKHLIIITVIPEL